MTGDAREALDALRRRVDHVAATASLLADCKDIADARIADALDGVAATLGEVATKMDALAKAGA